jgi:hypothetical protein
LLANPHPIVPAGTNAAKKSESTMIRIPTMKRDIQPQYIIGLNLRLTKQTKQAPINVIIEKRIIAVPRT